jgi:hypothetical protein
MTEAEENYCWSTIEEVLSRGEDSTAPLGERLKRIADGIRSLALAGDPSPFLRRFLDVSVDLDRVRAAAEPIDHSIAIVAELARTAGYNTTAAQTFAFDWVAGLQGGLLLLAFLSEPDGLIRTLDRLLALEKIRHTLN